MFSYTRIHSFFAEEKSRAERSQETNKLKANNKEKTGLVSALVITQERDAREKEQKEIGSMQFFHHT